MLTFAFRHLFHHHRCSKTPNSRNNRLICFFPALDESAASLAQLRSKLTQLSAHHGLPVAPPRPKLQQAHLRTFAKPRLCSPLPQQNRNINPAKAPKAPPAAAARFYHGAPTGYSVGLPPLSHNTCQLLCRNASALPPSGHATNNARRLLRRKLPSVTSASALGNASNASRFFCAPGMSLTAFPRQRRPANLRRDTNCLRSHNRSRNARVFRPCRSQSSSSRFLNHRLSALARNSAAVIAPHPKQKSALTLSHHKPKRLCGEAAAALPQTPLRIALAIFRSMLLCGFTLRLATQYFGTIPASAPESWLGRNAALGDLPNKSPFPISASNLRIFPRQSAFAALRPSAKAFGLG